MRTFWKKATRVFDRLVGIFGAVAAGILLFVVLLTSVEVGTRFFLNFPIVWSVEISEYALLFITFLTAAWVLRGEGHVTVDLVLNCFKPRTRFMIRSVTYIITAVGCLVIGYYSSLATWRQYETHTFSPSFLNIPNAYTMFIIPIGFFLLFIQLLRNSYGYLKQRKAF